MKNDKQLKLSWKGVLAVIVGTILIGSLFLHFGRYDLARPTMFSIAMIVIAIIMKWELRERVWFWVAMAAIVALHISVILYLTWTTRWVPAVVITPIGLADLAVIPAVIKFLEKLFGKATTRDGGASSLN